MRCPSRPVEALFRQKHGFLSCFRLCRKEKLSFWPCRQRSEPCDKMALYNFKKIMVVPTAKVRFVRRINVLDWTLFHPVYLSSLRAEYTLRNAKESSQEGKHVSSSRLGLYEINVEYKSETMNGCVINYFNVVDILVLRFY